MISKKLFGSVALGLFCLSNTQAQVCPESALQSTGVLRFRQQGDIFEVPIQMSGCDALGLEVRWSNGRNNGSNFHITFVDGNRQAIYTKEINGFLTGSYDFPFNTLEPQPWYGANRSNAMFSVPTSVFIQAVRPFAFPASISYRISRVAKNKAEERVTGGGNELETRSHVGKKENEIVSIHRATRLIGASRLSLVQIELKAANPFPVRDTALQLQIGKRVFLNELSGDFTGRLLTLSLTPEMFAELEDGGEIVAFFDKRDGDDARRFGKLNKSLLSEK